jgi:hypothetical protein
MRSLALSRLEIAVRQYLHSTTGMSLARFLNTGHESPVRKSRDPSWPPPPMFYKLESIEVGIGKDKLTDDGLSA